MGCCSVELCLTNIVLLGVFVFGAKKLYQIYKNWKLDKILEKFDHAPKDKVILHALPRAKVAPSVSPFALKTETYLRLAKIPYELDTTEPQGPKGRVPWMSFNGTHMGDSALIIQFLNRKLGVNLNSGRSEEQIATAKACALILENHFISAILQYRLVENSGSFSTIMKIPAINTAHGIALRMFLFMAPYVIKKRLVQNGIGLHTPTELYQLTEEDLRIVAKLLGNKKFFGGDEPCEHDCGIFGQVAQAVWAMPGSSCERLVHGELITLKNYCERMKERVWPDWDSCLDK